MEEKHSAQRPPVYDMSRESASGDHRMNMSRPPLSNRNGDDDRDYRRDRGGCGERRLGRRGGGRPRGRGRGGGMRRGRGRGRGRGGGQRGRRRVESTTDLKQQLKYFKDRLQRNRNADKRMKFDQVKWHDLSSSDEMMKSSDSGSSVVPSSYISSSSGSSSISMMKSVIGVGSVIYNEQTNEELMNEIISANDSNKSGIESVKCLSYDENWYCFADLRNGKWRWYSSLTNENLPSKPTSVDISKQCSERWKPYPVYIPPKPELLDFSGLINRHCLINHSIIPVMSNSYTLSGNLFKSKSVSIELYSVTLEPHIDSWSPLELDAVLEGLDNNQRRFKKHKLRGIFGDFYFRSNNVFYVVRLPNLNNNSFDNDDDDGRRSVSLVSTMTLGKPVYTFPSLKDVCLRSGGATIDRREAKRECLDERYSITLRQTDRYSLNDPQISDAQKRGLLNVIKNEIMVRAGFEKFGSQAWFPKNILMRNVNQSMENSDEDDDDYGDESLKKEQRRKKKRKKHECLEPMITRSGMEILSGVKATISFASKSQVVFDDSHPLSEIAALRRREGSSFGSSSAGSSAISSCGSASKDDAAVPASLVSDPSSLALFHGRVELPAPLALPVIKVTEVLKCVDSEHLSHKIAKLMDEIRKDTRPSDWSLENVQCKVNKLLCGRSFILSYDCRPLRIDRVDFSLNERSTFPLRSGLKKREISYADYVTEKYRIRSDLREMCVIRSEDSGVFLPQHCRLTLSPQKSESTEYKSYFNPTSNIRVSNNNAFVRQFNQAAAEYLSDPHLIRLSEHPVTTQAIELLAPKVWFSPLREFVDAWDAPWERRTKFTSNSKSKLRHWSVVWDPSLPGFENCGKLVLDAVEAYRKQRGLRDADDKNARMHLPKLRPIDHLSEEISRFGELVDISDVFLMIVIPDPPKGFNDSDTGAIMKAFIGDYVQSAERHRPVQKQFVRLNTLINNPKFTRTHGMFDDIFSKMCYAHFMLDPMAATLLPRIVNDNCDDDESQLHLQLMNELMMPDNIWTIGMGSHSKLSIKKPTTMAVSVDRFPFEGSIRGQTNQVHLIPQNRNNNILGYEQSNKLFFDTLKKAMTNALCDEKPKHRRLPKTILVFRSGISNGGMNELSSKEVNGLAHAIHEIRKDKDYWIQVVSKELYKSNIRKWKPKVQWIISIKKTINHYSGIKDKKHESGLLMSEKYSSSSSSDDSKSELSSESEKYGRGMKRMMMRGMSKPKATPLNRAAVIYDDIFDPNRFVFELWPFSKDKLTKNYELTRAVQYCILEDGLGLGKHNSHLLPAFFQIVYSLSFVYVYSMPNIYTSLPGPIKYATHFAQSMSSRILGEKTKLSELVSHQSLKHVPSVLDWTSLKKNEMKKKKDERKPQESEHGSHDTSSGVATVVSAAVHPTPDATQVICDDDLIRTEE